LESFSLSATHSSLTQKKTLFGHRLCHSKQVGNRDQSSDSNVSVQRNESAETTFIIAQARRGFNAMEISDAGSESKSDSAIVNPWQEEVD